MNLKMVILVIASILLLSIISCDFSEEPYITDISFTGPYNISTIKLGSSCEVNNVVLPMPEYLNDGSPELVYTFSIIPSTISLEQLKITIINPDSSNQCVVVGNTIKLRMINLVDISVSLSDLVGSENGHWTEDLVIKYQ